MKVNREVKWYFNSKSSKFKIVKLKQNVNISEILSSNLPRKSWTSSSAAASVAESWLEAKIKRRSAAHQTGQPGRAWAVGQPSVIWLRVVETIEAKTVLLGWWLLLLGLEILHDILRILGDLTRNWSTKLKGTEAAVRRHRIGLQWPPLGTHVLCAVWISPREKLIYIHSIIFEKKNSEVRLR